MCLCLDRIQLVIATQHQCDQRRPTLATVHQQRLHQSRCGQLELRGQLCDGVHTGCCNGGAVLERGRAIRGRGERFGFFDVGGELAATADRNRIFPGFREHVELVRLAAADTAGVGEHGTKFESDTLRRSGCRRDTFHGRSHRVKSHRYEKSKHPS